MARPVTKLGDCSNSCRPLIIPVFIPHRGCRHRCVFCNQSIISGARAQIPTAEVVRRQVSPFLDLKGRRRGTTEIAFYGGNFLGLPTAEIDACLDAAAAYVRNGAADGIRFSTRPDSVTGARLEQIAAFPVKTVELGVQSLDDGVLRRIRRGHTAADSEIAVTQLQRRGYEVGCQIMTGLPGDDDAGAMATARRIADLSPDFVRIYPTVVLAGTELAEWYRAGSYTPVPLEACVDLAAVLYRIFCGRGVRVVRMGLQATGQLDSGGRVLAGPYHPAFGHLVHSRIFLEQALAAVRQLALRARKVEGILLRVNPRDESRLRGLKNGNLTALERVFPGREIRVLADTAVTPGALRAAFSREMDRRRATRRRRGRGKSEGFGYAGTGDRWP
jgi:histone acetyltransferase (RNA polymerase elongator complex component)